MTEMSDRAKRAIFFSVVFLLVFLIGFLPSFLYANKWVKVADYTMSNAIYVWDSEAEEGVIYAYHPYRNTTEVPTDTGTFIDFWIKQGDTYLHDNFHKHNIWNTDKPLKRQDFLDRFGDNEIVDALMTHDYMTEWVIPGKLGGGWDGRDSNGDYGNPWEPELIPIHGKENLSYAFCKVSGKITRDGFLTHHRATYNHFQY